MYSFKFYYLEACDNLKIKPSEKLLLKIEESTNATNLDLSTVKLTDDTCKTIGFALKKDVFLRELDLSNCMLSDDGLSNILSGLEENKFLLTLNLKGNNIRSAGTAVIGKFLRHNNHLQNLYLEWNSTGIFPEKFSYFCEGLSLNSALRSLDLRNNQLNHLCAQSISDVICRNSTLEKLDLRWNSIGLIGGRAILKSLTKNKSILKLDISGNDIPLEIQKSVELVTSVTAERYIKHSESVDRTKFFASKLQELEAEQNKQLRTLMEQLEKKDQDFESNQRWNSAKLTQLQEKLKEKDYEIEELNKNSQDLQKNINHIVKEKNDIALALNEMTTKNRDLKKEFGALLDKEKQEYQDTERKFFEEIGTIKEENLCLKQKVQEFQIMQKNLEDQAIKQKGTIDKIEKMSKLQEQSFQEQISALDEQHKETVKEMDLIRKNEIARIKEKFSAIEKDLRQQVRELENKRNDLEKQLTEKDVLIMENKAHDEEMMDELKKKMKNNEDKLRKQMEEQIELLKSANKEQEELLKEDLETMYEIKKLAAENDILSAEKARHARYLEHIIKTKDTEMDTAIAKIKLEVKEQVEELDKVKNSLQDSLTENASLKQKIKDIEKQHKEELKDKKKEIESLKSEVEKQKNKLKHINDLQSAFASYFNSVKLAIDEETLEDKLDINS